MNTGELIDHLAAATGLTKAQSKQALEAVLGGIQTAAVKGEEVSLGGFGKFKVQDKPARQARNPRTGETIEVAAAKKVVFTPAKALKDAVQG
ncbi:MAG: HU family DNA-binding protein [Caulobacteraceae bacterium]|jgi:DNA-binding protein HU-beta